MKLGFALLFLLLSLVTARTAPQDTKPPISKEAAQGAIAIFRGQPANDMGRRAMAIILRFAEQSPDVQVRIDAGQMGWMGPKSDLKTSSILLAAYIAGSVRAQLEKGTSQHDALASAEQVIETYQLLQQADPKLRIAPVEDLIALKAQGKLAESLGPK